MSNYNEPWEGSEKGHVTGSVIGIAADQHTTGYWILNSVGGVSGFGAAWYGSAAGTQLSGPPVGLTAP